MSDPSEDQEGPWQHGWGEPGSRCTGLRLFGTLRDRDSCCAEPGDLVHVDFSNRAPEAIGDRLQVFSRERNLAAHQPTDDFGHRAEPPNESRRSGSGAYRDKVVDERASSWT